MFSVCVAVPTLSFLVLAYYTNSVIKHVVSDCVRYTGYLVGFYTIPWPTRARVYLPAQQGFKTIDVTNHVVALLKGAKRNNPLATQLTLNVTRTVHKPHFLALEYVHSNKKHYTRFYSRSTGILFPPPEKKARAPVPTSWYLLLQYTSPDRSIHKQARCDVTTEIAKLMGPDGDWFGNTQRVPSVIYIHLWPTISKLVAPEDASGKLTLTLKNKYHSSLSLTKFLPCAPDDCN